MRPRLVLAAIWIGAGSTACSSGGAEGGITQAAGAGGYGAGGAPVVVAGIGGQAGTNDGQLAGSGNSSAGAATSTAGVGGALAADGGSAGAGGGGGATAAPAGTPVFVAVGYSGRRIRSTDLGESWIDEQTLGGGGDDEFLLRAVGFGAGSFVAVGWKVLTSPDGKTWSERDNPQHQWLGGVQFASGFVATGGYGYCAHSSDGESWSPCKSIPNNEASRSLALGMGLFVTATDPGNWYQSADGAQWSLLSGGHGSNQVAFCGGSFKEYAQCSGAFNARGRASAAGVTVRLADGKLERSSNGNDFTPVAGSPGGLEDVAVGFLP